MIDGKGPGNGHKKEKAPITDLRESGDLRIATVDATAAYNGVKRVHRHFVLAGESALIVLDDIEPAQTATITAQYQAAFEAAPSGGGAFTITSPAGAVRVRTFGPALTFAVEPRPWNDKDWILRDSALKWHAVTGTYASTDGPLVTVITRDGAGEVSVERDGSSVRVLLPGGRTVRFAGDTNGWTFRE